MSASDEAMRRAMQLEDERLRPVPAPGLVRAVSDRDLRLVLSLVSARYKYQDLGTEPFRAAQRMAAAAGIEFPEERD